MGKRGFRAFGRAALALAAGSTLLYSPVCAAEEAHIQGNPWGPGLPKRGWKPFSPEEQRAFEAAEGRSKNIEQKEKSGGPGQTSLNPLPVSDGSQQQQALTAATTVDAASKQATAAAAQQAYNAGDLDLRTARYETTLADSLAALYDQVKAFTKPRLASTNPDLRDEAARKLREAPSPPANFSDAYSRLGLGTNQDVLDKVPQYVKNLADDANKNEDRADREQQSGDQSMAAANALGGFQRRLGNSASNLHSIDATPSGISDGENSRDYAGSPVASPASGSRSGLSDHSRPGKASGESDPLADGAGADGAQAGANPANGPGRNGLRDRLRRDLAGTGGGSGGAKGDAEKTPDPNGYLTGPQSDREGAEAKRSIASLYEGGTESPGADGERGARFSMARSDTDKAVARMVGEGGLGGSASEAELGSPDVSLFTRTSKFLAKAQADRKVLGRR